MIVARACRGYLRTKLFVVVPLVFVVCVGLIVYAKASKQMRGPFDLAEDFPRGALVYAQCKDLPALIRQWNESTLKQQYLNSTNFQQFQQRHLALKLVERWEEFNSALGFTLDAATISESSENRAAIAVYDIGRLEMVFIAPISEERSAATKFFQSKDQFEQTELPDGTLYYSREVEADRGRQKQKIAFAMLRGRFVLATSERLLLRAIANINNKVKKDRLSDDPSFAALSREVQPHFATVWVDQSRLNSDWYFKRYWLMQDVTQLKNIRAGMFDLEVRDGKWIERRDFLYAGKAVKNSAIPVAEMRRISGMIPATVPYFKVQALDGGSLAAATLIRDTLLDNSQQSEEESSYSWSWHSYSNSDFYDDDGDESWWEGRRYSYLDSEYDSIIDDPADAGINDEPDHGQLKEEAEGRYEAALQQALQLAHPLFAATAESPQAMTGPLFVDFRRAALVTLQTPGKLDQPALERALSGLVQGRLTIAGPVASLPWTNRNEAGHEWRELELPMLGWKLCYALRGRELVLANSTELLRSILTSQKEQRPLTIDSKAALDKLTVIRLDQREQAFDQIFEKLDAPHIRDYWKARRRNHQDGLGDPPQEFFSGNIASLLSVASRVSEIEIRSVSSSGRLREDIEIRLR